MNVVVSLSLRGQTQVQRLSLGHGDTLRVGRGWQNDVVIDDRYVDPTHLLVTVDDTGVIHLTDAGSRNGSRVGRRRIETDTRYEPGERIYLGDTVLTLSNADTPVVPAQARDRINALTHRLATLPGLLVMTLLAAAAILLDIHWLQAQEITAEHLATQYAVFGSLLVGWSLFAGLIGKLFRHEALFSRHWVYMCLLIIGTELITLLQEIASFNLDMREFHTLAPEVASSLVTLGIVYGFLSLSTTLRTRLRTSLAMLVALLPLAHTLIMPMLGDDRDHWTAVAIRGPANFPPALLFSSPAGLDEHLDATSRLFASLAEEVRSGSAAVESMTPNDDGPVVVSER